MGPMGPMGKETGPIFETPRTRAKVQGAEGVGNPQSVGDAAHAEHHRQSRAAEDKPQPYHTKKGAS